MDELRVVGMCALIFVSCTGLGAAAFWVTAIAGERVTRKEVRRLVWILALSALSTWTLMIVAPDRMLRSVGAFLVAYSAVVSILLVVIRYKIKKHAEEAASE